MSSVTNWAVLDNGAEIADLSGEAAAAGGSASNVLRTHNNAPWIAGDAPQHLTLRLSPSHPPLRYAGWHVGHDVRTNPKMVEISSGPSTAQLRSVLICRALPGAGTQVWKLPQQIPSHHRYARFTIEATFGASPASLNNLVLLENDPGSAYSVNEEAISVLPHSMSLQGGAHIGTEASPHHTFPPPQQQQPSPTSRLLNLSRFSATPNARPHTAVDHGSPLSPAHNTPPSGPPIPPAGAIQSATSRDRFESEAEATRSDVGVFNTHVRTGSKHNGRASSINTRQEDTRQRSNSRMTRLLRDLDDDIKLLKPIKAADAGRNMLMYMPQEPSDVYLEDLEEKLSCRCNHSDTDNEKDGKKARAKDGSSTPQKSPQENAPLMHVALYPSASNNGAVPMQPLLLSSANHDERLNALERAVAALNEVVQHQRDDLTMIKRLLLQQATERRKEAEQRCFDPRTHGAITVLRAEPPSPPPPPAPAPAPAPTPPATHTATTIIHTVPHDQWLTHRNVTVEFPEDTLRAFVEGVLEHRFHRYTKKVEAKLLERLDRQLRDVIRILSATVDGQPANAAVHTAAPKSFTSPFANYAAAAAAAATAAATATGASASRSSGQRTPPPPPSSRYADNGASEGTWRSRHVASEEVRGGHQYGDGGFFGKSSRSTPHSSFSRHGRVDRKAMKS